MSECKTSASDFPSCYDIFMRQLLSFLVFTIALPTWFLMYLDIAYVFKLYKDDEFLKGTVKAMKDK